APRRAAPAARRRSGARRGPARRGSRAPGRRPARTPAPRQRSPGAPPRRAPRRRPARRAPRARRRRCPPTASHGRLPARGARLDAHLRVGEDLVRVGAPLGIEHGPQPDHRGEIVGAEEERHLPDLLDPDAVLAGQAPAERDAGLEDLAPRRQHAPHLVPVALVEEEDRVDVAVASVEDVGDAEPVALGRRRDAAEDVGHPRPRHDAVLRAVVGRKPADGAEGALAALPERGALRLVARTRRRVARVTMPNVPSAPTTRPTRSYPGRSSTAPPSATTSPDGSTSSTPRTWFVVTPYLRVCGPPEFLAMLPPMVHAGWLDGSGA